VCTKIYQGSHQLVSVGFKNAPCQTWTSFLSLAPTPCLSHFLPWTPFPGNSRPCFHLANILWKSRFGTQQNVLWRWSVNCKFVVFCVFDFKGFLPGEGGRHADLRGFTLFQLVLSGITLYYITLLCITVFLVDTMSLFTVFCELWVCKKWLIVSTRINITHQDATLQNYCISLYITVHYYT
jgi:hypothetical protein